MLTGLAGLLQTARLEHPTLAGQLIAVDPETDAEALAEILERECRVPSESRVRYDDGQRRVAGWREMATSLDRRASTPPWREGATYLITGGLGGLGRLLARDIMDRAAEVNLILVGRSAWGEDVSLALLNDAAPSGACIVYRQVDVTNRAAVIGLIRDIEREFGGLNGIIHAAGIIRDNAIRQKTAQEVRDVLAPKVAGLVHLDRATQHLDLDFLVCFSSMTAALGNPGQADYAAANAFMDAYAEYRNGLVAAGQRRGRTLSINWPLWREGGMAMVDGDGAWESLMRQKTGMIAMRTDDGPARALPGLGRRGRPNPRGRGRRVRYPGTVIPRDLCCRRAAEPVGLADVGPDRLREHTVHQLKRLLADYLKLDVTYVDADEPLEHYGIDSIMIKQLNEKLAAVFGKLSATLFYEYQTLMALADYLVREHGAACLRWSAPSSANASTSVPAYTASVSDRTVVLVPNPPREQGGECLCAPDGRQRPLASPSPSLG